MTRSRLVWTFPVWALPLLLPVMVLIWLGLLCWHLFWLAVTLVLWTTRQVVSAFAALAAYRSRTKD